MAPDLATPPPERGPRPRVAVMQPYFCPAPSYFHLLHAVDTFVFFDDVQFVTKRWTHRNRLIIGTDEYSFTVPLSGRSQNRNLNEIAVHPVQYPRWRAKFLKTLAMQYGPGETIDALAAVLDVSGVSLARLAADSVMWAAGRIGLTPDFAFSSQMEYDRQGDRVEKLLSICRTTGAASYVNAPGGRRLYTHPQFDAEGVSLRFVSPGSIPAEFERVSILHALFSLPPQEVHDMVARYTLEKDAADG